MFIFPIYHVHVPSGKISYVPMVHPHFQIAIVKIAEIT